MRKIIAAILLIFFAGTHGCKAPDIVHIKLDSSRTVGLRMGQVLRLDLDSNATTGYTWEISERSEIETLNPKGRPRYVVPESRLAGAGGYQMFRFIPVRQGSAVIRFEYLRPWEKGIKPVKTFIVRVVIT